jgi:hypothetical protein
MLSKRALGLAVGLAVLPRMADAAEDAARCVDALVPKQAAEARHGKWIELTSDQWQFLRGIYAMNPLTPPGLPYGDKLRSSGSTAARAAWCSSSTAIRPARRWRFPTSFSP